MTGETPLEISVQDVAALLAKDEIHLLDCREQIEWDVARIDNSVLIPMSRITDEGEQLETLRDRPLVVHCHHGVRSLQVVNWLRQKGFANAQSMVGGIEQWSQQIDSTVPLY